MCSLMCMHVFLLTPASVELAVSESEQQMQNTVMCLPLDSFDFCPVPRLQFDL